MTFLQKARTVVLPLVTVLAILVFASAAEACPTCKDSLGGDPAQQRMVTGYFYSILFMMSMPFLILGCFSSCMYVAVRKARKAEDAGEEGPMSTQDS